MFTNVEIVVKSEFLPIFFPLNLEQNYSFFQDPSSIGECKDNNDEQLLVPVQVEPLPDHSKELALHMKRYRDVSLFFSIPEMWTE